MKSKEKVVREMDCPYCGSMVMVEQESGEGIEELRRKAALTCGCPQAEKYRTEDEIRLCINQDMPEPKQIQGVLSMIELVRADLYDSVKPVRAGWKGKTMEIGQKITIRERIREEMRSKYTEREVEYTVKKIYPHVVLCEQEETGIRRCLCLGDMIVKGILEQPPGMAAERAIAERENKYPPRWA